MSLGDLSFKESLPRGVPFIRGIHSWEEAHKYGVGPTHLVSFKDTEYALLKEPGFQVDPVLWAQSVSMWDNRLLPAVQEVQRVEGFIFGNALKRQKEAQARNAPLLARIDCLVKEEATLRDQTRKAILEKVSDIPGKVEELAKAFGALGLELKEGPAFELPDKRLMHSKAAHAANLELPHDPDEAKHFLKGWLYWAVTGVTGCLFGISAFSVPGMVHPAALAKDPPGIVLFAMLSGVGFTTLAGRAMRLNFRHAAENLYLGKKRRLGALTVAAISNLILAGLYTVVDAIGLMKASGVMAQIAALNGSKPAGSSVDIAYIVAAGAFSITYTAYSSISGWMEARTSAANRITKACEDESIESIKEVQASDGFAGAIAALNTVRVDDVAAVQVEAAYERALVQISKEREAIVAKLIVSVDCTEEEALLLERARTEAEGRQMEFDRLIATLRDQLTNGTAKDSGGDARAGMSGPRDNSRLGSILRGAISRLSGPGERAT